MCQFRAGTEVPWALRGRADMPDHPPTPGRPPPVRVRPHSFTGLLLLVNPYEVAALLCEAARALLGEIVALETERQGVALDAVHAQVGLGLVELCRVRDPTPQHLSLRDVEVDPLGIFGRVDLERPFGND